LSPPQTPGNSASLAACNASAFHFTHYPGGAQGLGQLPWVKGSQVEASPSSQGLVGLIWYWSDRWRAERIKSAQLYAGGHAPAGDPNMKILWIFLGAKARRATDAQLLVVKGKRLDAPGRSWQRFSAISYSGQNRAPSFASVIDVPAAGCWRLDLTAGSLHGTTIFTALSANQ
jgi:hypothetical protein